MFPAEYRSLASGTMNFIGRGFTAISVVLAEYTSQPIIFVLFISGGLIFVLAAFISEPGDSTTAEDQYDDFFSERSNNVKAAKWILDLFNFNPTI